MKCLMAFLTCVFYSTQGFAFQKQNLDISKPFPNSLQGRDFYVTQGTKKFESKDTSNCRQMIPEIMCLVEPTEPGQHPADRPCLEGGKAYAHHFEALYDHYPEILQRMFCHLQAIYIEKQFLGTAFAGLRLDDNGNSVGAEIGIRKSVLDEELDLKTWASWKEQLSFGGVTDSYTLTPGLPKIITASMPPANDFLYFVVSHEFAHIFDFSNKINELVDCPEPTEENPNPECPVRPDSWGAISWKTNLRAKPENEFSHRTALCFYWCDGNVIERAHIPGIYQSLYLHTDFLSLYSTTQPWDDFADSLAYFLMDEYLQTLYLIDTNEDHFYDIIRKLHSKKFVKKYEYLKDFLARDDIVYP